jgi:ParB family chromosome partitioning protein
LEKKGLGKGLGALIPGAERETRGSGSEVEISRISTNPYQPRGQYDDEKLQELVDSVRVHGVLQPIVVRTKGGGDYELVAGERRLRAAKAAGLSRIPAVIRELTNEQSIEVALVENIQREDINAIDAAVAYKRLTDEFGLSQEDVAFGMGKSRSAIANTMRLLGLPESVKEELRSGRISEGHARAILSVEGESRQVEVCKRITDLAMSVREAERLARIWGDPTATRADVSRETIRTPLPEDPNLLEAEAQLRRIFGTKVTIVKNKDRGRIVIEFYTDDDLERLLLMFCG